MKISIEWLKTYIQLDLSVPELIDTLDRIGLLVDSWEELEKDVVLEIETYANRPDTLGHLGVARELAAALGQPLKGTDWPLTEADEDIEDVFDIQIQDEELCPRYCGKIVRGVQVGPSPTWLQERLTVLGLNPINNVVDVTNYVLFATAQPIHAFDLGKLEGETIVVRRAKKNESLRTLEGVDVSLSQDMLVIADKRKPVALAGIMGGEESGVTENTQDILIECAHFNPVSIRKTWKKLAMPTDASYRFERCTDVSFPPKAAAMAASLLCQLGGTALKGTLDVYPKPRKPKAVVLRHHRIADLLGVEVERDFVENTLVRLDMQVKSPQAGVWQVQVPTFRVDIEREADLVEEIARFFGYENIPSQLPLLQTEDVKIDPTRAANERMRQLLFHEGFDEVVNYSFTDSSREKALNSGLEALGIRNPISSRASHLRTNLVGGLLETIAWNRNRGTEGVHIFEIGNVHFWADTISRERRHLALATAGRLGGHHWQGGSRETDFFHLKGALEHLLSQMRFEPVAFADGMAPFYQEGYSLEMMVKGSVVGSLGLLKPEILELFDLKENVWAAEIDLDNLFEIQPHPFQYTSVIRFPSIVRDVSFIVSRNVSYQEIKAAVDKLVLPHLESYDLYDRYTGSSIPEDKVSLSMRFHFRSPQKTLLAEEVDELQAKIMKALQSGFDLEFRKGGEN
jgi:phenylalanyl-tRNA synthetase beta chain